MDPDQGSEFLALEKALYDESVEPAPLSLSLLKAITKNFSKGEQIGSGGFGEVYKGKLRDGTVAVKRLYSAIVIDEKNFQSEVDSLLGVRHKNTVRFLGYCSDTQQVMDKVNGATVWAEQRQRLLCFEFLPKGSLADYITDPSSGLPWETRYQIIKGICEGVHYLHKQHIIHMDLKPQNILLDGNMMPKVADFGQSRRLSEDQSRTITEHIVGSRRYCAPEFIGRGVITKKNDIYGLGVIFLEVLTGCKGTDKVEEVLESWMNVLETTPEHPIPLEQVKLCAEIGIQCMNDDPKNRPTTWDIILMLFDKEEISNWSTRGVVRSPSIAQEMPFIAKLEYELKLMNLYGWPFLPKRVSPLKRIEETSTEMIHLGFTDSKIPDIHPLKLQFRFEAGKRTSCPLSLTSKADQYVRFCIVPEFKDMYLCEENELVDPMSTCGVSITLMEQQQRPLKMIYILMITSESKSALENFMTSISWDDMIHKVDLPQRVEELGCQMHVAMVTGVVCPQSAMPIAPKIIFTQESLSFNTTMDVHPTEPWILLVENFRQVSIWDHRTQKVVMSFYANEKQRWVKKIIDDDILVHAAKFIPRKQWFVTGEDYGNIRVYSCVTMTEIMKFRAYFTAHIISLAVHPTYPLLITLAVWVNCEDPIRLWDWDMGWKCSQRISWGSASVFRNKLRFKFNPKDTTTFAGAQDGICHVWSIHSSKPLIKIMSPKCDGDVCDYPYTDSHPQYVITSGQYGVVRQVYWPCRLPPGTSPNGWRFTKWGCFLLELRYLQASEDFLMGTSQ
ncbi:hypothetical protein ACQJBY_072194 [Aegilops geniculata]